jgi:DNA (cytosine-5)-methyltransferase 1
MSNESVFTYYEFFAGGGMARLGLGEQWKCLFANDFSPRKVKSYRENFHPADELVEADIFDLSTNDLPINADMAWASFPCQDLSLAGQGLGLRGNRSGSFWGFWQLIDSLAKEGRPLPIIVLENVVGTISVRQGMDFQVLLETIASAGYKFGPLIIDGSLFVPQSRPRLFIVAVRDDIELPLAVVRQHADNVWHSPSLYKSLLNASVSVRNNWVWWAMPYPPPRRLKLSDLLENDPQNVRWHTEQETLRLLDLMSPTHRKRVRAAQLVGKQVVGTIYRRIRVENGIKAQRAEIRFDEISGCIRTGSGGSSKQFLMLIEGDRIRSRLFSPREVARLMGVDDSYQLPSNYSEAYHLMGDGLVVPAVNWLSQHLLIPLLTPNWFESSAYDRQASSFQPRLLEKMIMDLR